MASYLGKPVLVVDDSQTTVRVVRSLLARIGFKDIDDASNGMAALAKMTEKPYGIVIADWNMEPMSGYELLKQVRANPRLATTRLILMTAELNASHVITWSYYRLLRPANRICAGGRGSSRRTGSVPQRPPPR